MRYSLARPHFSVHFPRTSTYLLRHGDTHRWYVCRDCLHCVPMLDFLRRPWRCLAWLRDGQVH